MNIPSQLHGAPGWGDCQLQEATRIRKEDVSIQGKTRAVRQSPRCWFSLHAEAEGWLCYQGAVQKLGCLHSATDPATRLQLSPEESSLKPPKHTPVAQAVPAMLSCLCRVSHPGACVPECLEHQITPFSPSGRQRSSVPEAEKENRLTISGGPDWICPMVMPLSAWLFWNLPRKESLLWVFVRYWMKHDRH